MSTLNSTLVFYVNGKKVVDDAVDPEYTLLQYLRSNLRLCGTKLGCGEGGCGACTVMVSKYDRRNNIIKHISVNACLTPVCAVHGLAVTTVEGIGSTKTKLHPVQERIAKSHGSQCGFCTPGIVMSMYTLLRNEPLPTMDDMEVAFQGNLCRCTGYRPILEGFKTFTKESCCGKGSNCCMNDNGERENNPQTDKLYETSEFAPFDETQEPTFPPELQIRNYDEQSVTFKSSRVQWYRPSSLEELLKLKQTYPAARIVNGNTEVGVEVKFKNCYYPVILAPTSIPELLRVEYSDRGVTVGAATTLSGLEEICRHVIQTQPGEKTRSFAAILEMLKYFAGRQIRNVAAIGGNIVTASPISDLNPMFMATKCRLIAESTADGRREVAFDQTFFCGYRRTALQPNEILLAIYIPYTSEDEFVCGYKQARRRDDDIGIVIAGMRVKFEPQTIVIQDIALAFGGMAPTTVLAEKTMAALRGRRWNEETLTATYSLLADDLPLAASAPGGMIEYRRSLTTSFFFKFYLTVLQQRSETAEIPLEFLSSTKPFHRDPPRSAQYFQGVAAGQLSTDPIGRSLPHVSAQKQATGEAIYCDDIPHFENELYLALVTSSRAHANILNIDPSEALSMEGVVAFFSAKDLTPEGNATGPVFHDEQVFASEKVTCQGQVIGALVADNQARAQRAAKKVRIDYEDLQPVVLTIEDAIRHNSYMKNFKRQISDGDLDAGFAQADVVVEGQMRIGGQEHFYLETQCTVAVPKNEDEELELFVSSQNPTEAQMHVAKVLGIDANRVVCRVKRLGGGFGGKETRFHVVTIPCAVAASRLGRPVRCMLDRDEDMTITGTRHPFFGQYKVGATKDGKITALDINMYSNAGCSMDLSFSIMERALFHMDNCYKIPNIRGSGLLCYTNIPSSTAFRGFGGPQGMMIAENWMQDVASTLNMDPAQVRQMNLYNEGDQTHFHQTLSHCTIRRCWSDCLEMSEYRSQREAVDEYNRQNRWKKRGLAIIPTKFGISFTATWLNQAGALVHVYRDGSVLLTHGGTEMGQGLHTKMIQVASRALSIPVCKIHISETSTDKVPNTSATAASASSDLNGMAVLNACQTILQRLESYINANPKGCWDEWIQAAYMDRVSLSATGFYKTPGIGYDFDKNEGNPFNYFCFGVACSLVEIDCLTGDHQVLRTDIVMDVGESLNPAIDIGQIEGGFVQGYGLFTLEELTWSPSGFLYTRGPGMYKIPSFTDIPVELNVALLRGAPNPRAVYSSKAVGEPPLFLASSVFFAIKDAITSARNDEGIKGPFQLDSPATAERIRMACIDQFTKQFPPAEPGTFKPWSVTF